MALRSERSSAFANWNELIPVRSVGDYFDDGSGEPVQNLASLEDTQDLGCIFGSDHSHDPWDYGIL